MRLGSAGRLRRPALRLTSTKLASQPLILPPLLATALGFRAWNESGQQRTLIYSALVGFWSRRVLRRQPIRLTDRVLDRYAKNSCEGCRRHGKQAIRQRLEFVPGPRGALPPETLPKLGKQRYDYCNAGNRHS